MQEPGRALSVSKHGRLSWQRVYELPDLTQVIKFYASFAKYQQD